MESSVSSSRPRARIRSTTTSVGTSRSMTTCSGWSPRMVSSSSACCSVRGNPSSTKPGSTSLRFANRSATTATTRSSGTSSPRSMKSFASSPAETPAAAESRNIWPVDRCCIWKWRASRSPCVPFPEPCFPSRTMRGPRRPVMESSGEEALVVPHHELRIDLLHGLQRDPDGDQQCGATERELRDVPEFEDEERDQGDDHQEDRPRQRDAIEDARQVLL